MIIIFDPELVCGLAETATECLQKIKNSKQMHTLKNRANMNSTIGFDVSKILV